MPSTLNGLPVELLQNISEFLPSNDLKNLRLVSQSFSRAATPSLFRWLTLYPTGESEAAYRQVSGSAELAKYVKTIQFNTQRRGFTAQPNREYTLHALEYMDTFKSGPPLNTRSMYIHFDRMCWAPDGESWTTWAEDVEFRTQVLREIFNLLAQPHCQEIDALSIKNLQNLNDILFTTSAEFKVILERLKSLRLFICTESYSASPENEILMYEMSQFMRELTPTWLQPTASRLTSLALYMDNYMGYAPKLDLRSIHFPCLRSLELGNYVFSHDWQLDWIISHANTLASLSLDDCPILYQASSYWTFDAEHYPDLADEDEGIPEAEWYNYSTRWNTYLDRFHNELPSLRSFKFGASDWRWAKQLDSPVLLLQQEYFYIAFDSGIGPSQWVDSVSEYPEDGGKDAVQQPDFGEEDKIALLKLLKSLGEPVPADLTDSQGLHMDLQSLHV